MMSGLFALLARHAAAPTFGDLCGRLVGDFCDLLCFQPVDQHIQRKFKSGAAWGNFPFKVGGDMGGGPF